MKRIPLTQGKEAVVDDIFFMALEATGPWCVMKSRHTFYAQRGVIGTDGKQHTVLMHRVIFQFAAPFATDHLDHVNGNGLDNRLSNLRTTTYSFNGANSRLRSNNTSGYRGVSWDKRREKWQANITIQGLQFNLGRFGSKEKAAIAYNEEAIRAFGAHAKLNTIEGALHAKV